MKTSNKSVVFLVLSLIVFALLAPASNGSYVNAKAICGGIGITIHPTCVPTLQTYTPIPPTITMTPTISQTPTVTNTVTNTATPTSSRTPRATKTPTQTATDTDVPADTETPIS